MILDKNLILEYQQNRDPYLLIDFASDVEPGRYARGYVDLKPDRWFFKVHWPNDPNMPGMLQIEALTQMSALSLLTMDGNKGHLVYLLGANNLLFKKKVLPNKRLEIDTKVIKYSRGYAEINASGYVEESLVCKADLKVVMPHILKNYDVKK